MSLEPMKIEPALPDTMELVKVARIEQIYGLTRRAIEQAKEQRELLKEYISSCLVEGEDYGKIPGGKLEKNVLHKPGAEKLCQIFKLRPDFRSLEIIQDFVKKMFFYRYACDLYHIPTGQLVGSGIGSCNSLEKKYGFRYEGRKCPACGAEAIKESKWADKNPDQGWYCYQKLGGCNARFHIQDPEITGQKTGKVPNEEICDLVNTLDKMAQKRAFLAATLMTVGCSQYFTQDLEEDDIDVRTGEVREKKKEGAGKNPVPASGSQENGSMAPLSSEDPFLDETVGTSPLPVKKAEEMVLKSELRRAILEVVKKDPAKTPDSALQFFMDNPKVKFDHIELAHQKDQLVKLEKALQIAQQWLKGFALTHGQYNE